MSADGDPRPPQSVCSSSRSDTAATRQLAAKSLESAQIRPVPDWITFSRDALRAQIGRIPSRDEIQPIVNEQLIVEFYSR